MNQLNQITHKIKHNIGDVVFLKTDSEQFDRIITGIMLHPQNAVTYRLSCGTIETWHYDIEISDEIDVLKTLNKTK